MMNTTKKLVIAVVALSLALVAFASVTLAWLTSTSDTVTNTFTHGDVQITLDEAKVDEYGESVTPSTRVTENKYKLIPGEEYTKDPTVHVAKGSEPCYVFVRVSNPLVEIIDTTNSIEAQMKVNKWTQLEGVDGVWYYTDEVDARTEAIDLPVFGSFKVLGIVDVSGYDNEAITITAYAVQKANLGTPEAAWNAAFAN